MMPDLSLNTQAILLLTAPLILGRSMPSPDLLAPGEYKRLARHLRELKSQPADLISPESSDLIMACASVIEETRLRNLLSRGFLLSQAVEHWRARAIWVLSRADEGYPRRLKGRLREDAPAVIYGCGDSTLLDCGGLAVVGSRHVDDSLIHYTMEIGSLSAHAGRMVISGGAKGIDQAAMRGALDAGGAVSGVLADSLEKTVMNRENRNLIIDRRLVLISPYDPAAGFNVGHAMQRNKLIYALADSSLVVNSDLNKGGTWAGAIEQLDKLKFVPVFVRSTGAASAGLDGLQRMGARPWPNPQDESAFEDVFNIAMESTSPQKGLSLTPNEDLSADDLRTTSLSENESVEVSRVEVGPSVEVDPIPDESPLTSVSGGLTQPTQEAIVSVESVKESVQVKNSPAEVLFAGVREAILQLLVAPMKDAEVAVSLDVSNAQAKLWLQRLVDEGELEKQKKPAGYVIKQKQIFE